MQLIHISSIIFVQSIMLAMFLLTIKSKTKQSNRLLAIYLLALTVRLFGFYGPRPVQYNFVFEAFTMTYFLNAPLLYLYLKSSIDKNFRLSKYNLLHTIPFFIFFMLIILKNKAGLSLNFLADSEFAFIESCRSVQFITYMAGFGIAYKRDSERWSYPLKNMEKPKKFWLLFFLWGNVAQFLFRTLAILFVFHIIYVPRWCTWLSSIIWLSSFLFLNSIVFIALKIPEVFTKMKHGKNGTLPDSELKRLNSKLLTLIETDKQFLDSTLSLPDLAKEMKISTNHLSHLINTVHNKNFYDFINGYRIEESKRILKQIKNGEMNILEVAYQVGFNSKSTFNSAFKRNTGLTPLQYKKEHKNN